jgi:hypothetical protein
MSCCHLHTVFYLGGQDAQVHLKGLHLHCSLATLQKEKPSFAVYSAACGPHRGWGQWFVCFS